jgi:quercetin dioxygenase-like cupin family protein
MRFPDRLRLPLAFDPDRLRADLARLEDSAPWIAHFITQNYDGDWSVIPLRGSAGETHPIRLIHSDPGAAAFADTAFLAPCAYFREVLAAFACELTSVRLMKLAPGSTIKEHTDPDLAAERGMARIHVPITTNPAVEFTVNGLPVALAPGEVWYLRLSDPHAVVNRGASDRVHLVLDAKVDAWLLDQMSQALAPERPSA